MNNEHLVSIITPTFRHGRWIVECIESVLSQSYRNWEMFIIDDGSEDDTDKLIFPYLKDKRITYLYQENRGVWRLAENYNRALKLSKGEYIAILEGDDFWPPDKLENQTPSFKNEIIGISYGRVLLADENSQIINEDILRIEDWKPPYKSFHDTSPLPFLRDLLLLRGNVGAVSLMLRRNYLVKVGGFIQDSGFPAVDFSTLLRIATISQATFVDKPLGIWRKHHGQVTEKYNLDYVLGQTQAAVFYYHSLPEEIKVELGISEKDILKSRRNYLSNAFWRVTRVGMTRKNWAVSRKSALQMIRWGNIFRKIEGVISFLAASIHVNLNPIIERAAITEIGRKLVR